MKTGEKILKEIRRHYIKIFSKGASEIEGGDVLKDELLNQLNNIIDYRGDRISLSTQRLFESLNFIAVITSIIWLVPFYFLYFQDPKGNELHLGIFGWLLVISVTFLIIIILSIIEDLDRPFDGLWRVNITSWKNLIVDIKLEYKNIKADSDIQQETTLLGNESILLIHSTSPQHPSPVKKEQETPVAISSTTAIPIADGDHHNVDVSKPNGKKPRQKKAVSPALQPEQMQGKQPTDVKGQKSPRKTSKDKKKASSALAAQPQVDVVGNEDGEKAIPFE